MKYKSNNNVVYSCKYHVVFCPKYRRSVLINGVDVRLKELLKETCDQRNVEIIEMEIMPDHVHLLMEIDPQYGVHKAVKQMKGYSSRILRQEFPWLKSRIPSLWTNSYFVSTVGGAPLSVIKQYIENQKNVSVVFMQLSETVKFYPTEYQLELIKATMTEYISVVNSLVSDATSGKSITKLTTADVKANLPSALINQCIRDAKSIVKKHYNSCHKAVLKNRSLAKKKSNIRVTAPSLPVLKKPCCYINNQNFKICGDFIEFPVMINGKSKRISVKTKMSDNQKSIVSSHKLGTIRIVVKGNSIVAQIVYDREEPVILSDGSVMGVDLGIKCPAVSDCSDGSVKFYGNGRKNKYMRRHYAYLRRKLQKSKKRKGIERINNKEQRIMKDIDHKLSHEIVATAVVHNVKAIKLEQLSNIRSTTKLSRKNNHSLHSWSFYRLAQFIEYKAKLAGIVVEYVNPAYTSQTCPICGSVHHANDRSYTCKCGFHTHRDLLGAMNLCNSTEYVGNRHTA